MYPSLLTSYDILQTRPSSPQQSLVPCPRCCADCAWFRDDCNHGCRSQTVRTLRSPSSGPSDAVCSCTAQCQIFALTHHGLPANSKYTTFLRSVCSGAATDFFIVNCLLICLFLFTFLGFSCATAVMCFTKHSLQSDDHRACPALNTIFSASINCR